MELQNWILGCLEIHWMPNTNPAQENEVLENQEEVSSFSFFLMVGFPQCLQNPNCPWNFVWAPLDPIQAQPLEVVLRNILEFQVQIPADPGQSLGQDQMEGWIF